MVLSEETLSQDWRSIEYAVVDLEGTGAQHREKEGIVDIAVVNVRGGVVTDHYSRLLDPGIKIPPFISRIHGIYDKDVKGRPTFETILTEIEAVLGDRALVAHNAPVERRVLNLKIPSYKPALIFDTLKMARALYGADSKQGLDELISRLHIQPLLADVEETSKRHGALYDAAATAHAFVYMAHENFPAGCPLRDLAEMCALDWKYGNQKQERHPTSEEKKSQSAFEW